ncbi:hypothetical protein CVT25_008006 [Psilocybe cyanescens]|uniref:Uncharacterized protein n=1 Tax=Psilocybe cyanescens TaxID=93625 RepID=A0A409VZI6_PSICY|nr:hypothetical protein CVT25_008006 [Psilocybe cyanescens]
MLVLTSGAETWVDKGTMAAPIQYRSLLTLQPHLISKLDQKAYDISDCAVAKLVTPDALNKDKTIRTDLVYHPQHPFPPNTKGYLYFHRLGDNRPPFTGEIRWRICDHHSNFEKGRDLWHHRYSSEPWSLSLPQLAGINHVAGLRHLLIHERLVDFGVISDLSRRSLDPLATILYDLDQPFLVDLSERSEHPMALVNRKSCVHFVLGTVFGENYADGTLRYPYTGLARVRLERSTLRKDAVVGFPTFFLKFLEFVSPVQCCISEYDYYIRQPKVGGYLQKKDGYGRYERWRFRPTESRRNEPMRATSP